MFTSVAREDQFFYVVLISRFSFAVFMDKSSTFPLVRRMLAHGHDGRKNDVVFCGSEAQQHVVFFPGDVQVRKKNCVIVNNSCSADESAEEIERTGYQVIQQ